MIVNHELFLSLASIYYAVFILIKKRCAASKPRRRLSDVERGGEEERHRLDSFGEYGVQEEGDGLPGVQTSTTGS